MEHEPTTKALFAKVNVNDIHSPEFSAHTLRVANGIFISLNALHNPQMLVEITSHMAAQHAATGGIKPQYFDVRKSVLVAQSAF